MARYYRKRNKRDKINPDIVGSITKIGDFLPEWDSKPVDDPDWFGGVEPPFNSEPGNPGNRVPVIIDPEDWDPDNWHDRTDPDHDHDVVRPVKPDIPVGPNSPGGFDIGSTPSNPNGNSDLDNNGIYTESAERVQAIAYVLERVKASTAYKQALDLFQNTRGADIFLTRLDAILSSISSAEFTIWDSLGLSNNFDDSVEEAYRYAIEQIQALLSEFHTWHNSLPVTQTQQFADAGVNSAVTGIGLTGSSLSPQNVSRNPFQSTNPMDVISGISDIAFNQIPNVVATVSNVWKSLQDVRLANKHYGLSERAQQFTEDSFLASARKSLIEQGFTLSDDSWSSISDFNKWIDNASADPKFSKLLSDERVDAFFSDLKYQGLTYATSDLGWTERNFGQTFEEFYNDLGNFQLDIFANNLRYQRALSKYNREYQEVLKGKDAGEAQNFENEMKKFQSQFEKIFASQKSNFLNTWISRIKKSKDPVAKFALSKVLFGDNLVSGLDIGSSGLNAVMDEFKKKGRGTFISPIGVGANLGF